MKNSPLPFAWTVPVLLLLGGCASPSEVHHRPGGGSVPYEVPIETSDPGSRIEVDGEYMGTSPLTVTI